MIPVVDLTRIIGWLKTAAADAVKWLAFRGLMIALITTLLPIAIYSGWVLIQEQIFNFVNGQMSDSVSAFESVSFQLVGLGAWLANCLQFPACLSVVMSGAAIKFVLGFFKS